MAHKKNPAGGNSLVFFLLSGRSPARNCQINLKIQGSVWLGGKSGAGGNYSERENESERLFPFGKLSKLKSAAQEIYLHIYPMVATLRQLLQTKLLPLVQQKDAK